jgi:phosphoserine phosphatase RsbU/P
MILTLGFLNFGLEASMLLANPGASVAPLFSIFFWHLTASLCLPWTWRESIRPIIPLFVSWALLRAGLAAGDGAWISFALMVGFAPLAFLPALVFCFVRLRWHQHRFKSGFVGRRFLQMRREFIQARAVHESLFPKPIDAGWMRFEFGYRPAADIGGDFVHVWIDERERFHLALIDVTGHGLASAMSVARIHGEIERLRDEYPDEGPAKILARLNRYFHRLLAKHRLYATGVLLTIDPVSGEVRYASAGHPPVFLRSRGKVTELPSTTFLLGAVDDGLFGEEEFSTKLEEGDTLILFTDGAYDARNPRGERFGLDRLREILQRPVAPPRWSQYLLRLVETFEAGMPEDDLLVAEINFRSRRSMSSITGDDLPVPAASGAGA